MERRFKLHHSKTYQRICEHDVKTTITRQGDTSILQCLQNDKYPLMTLSPKKTMEHPEVRRVWPGDGRDSKATFAQDHSVAV